MGRFRRAGRDERGQALLFFVGTITMVFVMAAIVVDVGLWLAERRSAYRAADLAALAGAQQLLANDSAAVTDARSWAAKNGFQDGVDGVTVSVGLLCSNNLPANNSGALCPNPSAPAPSSCTAGSGCDSVRVTIAKPSSLLFASIFGIDSLEIGATAVANLAVDQVVADTVIVGDASGSMLVNRSNGVICNASQSNIGCPIKHERDALNVFVDIVLRRPPVATKLGYVPFNWCYAPPMGSNSPCARESWVTVLTGSAAPLHNNINATAAGSSTNICYGLLRANGLYSGPDAQAGSRRAVVLVSNGDNNYRALTAHVQANHPPGACRPDFLGGMLTTAECEPVPQPHEVQLDIKTRVRADELKAQGVEIYVIGVNVCGLEDGANASGSYCAGIGNADGDNTADQRLLKCIATSSAHYQRVTPEQLVDTLRDLALKVVGRELAE